MSKQDRDPTISAEITHSFMPVEVHSDDPRLKHRVENTYRLEPAERFQYWRIREMVEKRLWELLEGVQYNEDKCRTLAVTISDFIRKDILDEGLERYKLVCHVMVCEKMDQAMSVGCRCLWDSTKDNFATATFENQTLIAVATIFALYYE